MNFLAVQGRPYFSDVDHPVDPKSLPEEEQGSYMDQYQRQRNHKANYKTYTLKDYRSLKREVKLGGLGPEVDTMTYKEKVSYMYLYCWP